MFKRVDIYESTPTEGYSYLNGCGNEEFVKLWDCNSGVFIQDDDGNEAAILKEDIPKLVRALQAAYSHKDYMSRTEVVDYGRDTARLTERVKAQQIQLDKLQDSIDETSRLQDIINRMADGRTFA